MGAKTKPPRKPGPCYDHKTWLTGWIQAEGPRAVLETWATPADARRLARWLLRWADWTERLQKREPK